MNNFWISWYFFKAIDFFNLILDVVPPTITDPITPLAPGVSQKAQLITPGFTTYFSLPVRHCEDVDVYVNATGDIEIFASFTQYPSYNSYSYKILPKCTEKKLHVSHSDPSFQAGTLYITVTCPSGCVTQNISIRADSYYGSYLSNS